MLTDNLITMVEVAPRDGLQADPSDLSTADKAELIRRLIDAGHTRIEAASFVSPRAVPKMADGDELMELVERPDHVTYSALAFNQAGLDRALAAGVNEITGVVVASETFSQKNQRATVAESISRWTSIARQAKSHGLRSSVTIATAFGCPFEGAINPENVADIVDRLADSEPDELCLADTIGVAVPNQVADLFSNASQRVGDTVLRGHFHNTRNTGLANVAGAIGAGVRVFDASLGGVGGCPFAPRATGNVPTEDVVYMVEQMGYSTGLNLDLLIQATHWFETVLGHPAPGLVAKAGGFPSPGC